MQYSQFKVGFDKPDVWRRSPEAKLPSKGKTYTECMKEIEEFEKLKDGAKKEICGVVEKNIDASKSINELNQRLNEALGHYAKAIIPCNDIDTHFLLNKTNENTLNKKLQGWCKNLVFNAKHIVESKPFQSLLHKFDDVPAFVCLAGPSLKNNRELLKQAKGKSLIIAVDTSLRPLLDIGVVPDICVTHDANPNGCKFFLPKDHVFNKTDFQLNPLPDDALAKIYAEMTKDTDRLAHNYDTLGLFVNYCHPLTLLAWNGREKRFYGVYDPSLPVYDCMAGCCDLQKDENGKLTPDVKGRIVGGSSVGHVATYAAVSLGCNPVTFLGLDLSYPGGKTYVEGASNQKSVEKQRLIDMNDLSGNKVKTNVSMLSYKMVFERSLPHITAQHKTKFYNCTEDDKGNPAGILEVGAYPKSLSWVIQTYCNKEVNAKEVFNSNE